MNVNNGSNSHRRSGFINNGLKSHGGDVSAYCNTPSAPSLSVTAKRGKTPDVTKMGGGISGSNKVKR